MVESQSLVVTTPLQSQSVPGSLGVHAIPSVPSLAANVHEPLGGTFSVVTQVRR